MNLVELFLNIWIHTYLIQDACYLVLVPLMTHSDAVQGICHILLLPKLLG